MLNQEFINKDTKSVIEMYTKHFEEKLQDSERSMPIINKIMQTCFKNINEEISSIDILKCRYDYVIYYVKKKIIDLISKYDINNLKIIFYNLAEYMAESHIHIYEKIYSLHGKKYWKYQSNEEDLIKKWLIDKINITNIDWASTLMGADNIFIQYIFILIDELEQLENKKIYSDEELSEDFFQIYELVTGMASLVEERDYLQLYFEQLKIVKVRNGIIITPEPVQEKIKSYRMNSIINAVKTNHSFSDKQYEKMDLIFKQDYGFATNDLELLFYKFIMEPEISNNLITIMSKSEFQSYIGKMLSGTKADSIIKYLLLKSNKKSDVMKSISQYDYRLFRNPLVELILDNNHFIIFSPYLFYYTISLLTKEIRYGCTKNINQNSMKKINNEIVERLESELTKYGLDHLTNYYIKNKESGKTYEVDLLFIKSNCLYIIECKDIKSKFTASETKNDIRRIKKEYIPNIKLKYSIIAEDEEKFKLEIESNFKTIKKVLVFKNYTFAKELIMSILTENDIELLTEAELIELIRR